MRGQREKSKAPNLINGCLLTHKILFMLYTIHRVVSIIASSSWNRRPLRRCMHFMMTRGWAGEEPHPPGLSAAFVVSLGQQVRGLSNIALRQLNIIMMRQGDRWAWLPCSLIVEVGVVRLWACHQCDAEWAWLGLW